MRARYPRPVPRSVRRTVALGVAGWVGVLGGLRAIVTQPEHCGDPSTATLRGAATRAVRWLAVNQRADGAFLYRFDRPRQEDLGGYNSVRHAGVVMSLEQAAAAGIDGATDAAARGTAWALDHVLADGDLLGFRGVDEAPTSGGTALLTAALVTARQRTGDDRHDDTLRGLGRFMVAMTLPSGAVEGRWDVERRAPVPGSGNEFFTGEVFWALALLHQELPDDGFGDVAERIGRYLTVRDEVEGIWPDVTDHWAAYGYAAMSAWPNPPELDERQLAYIRKQAEMQSLEIRYESQRTNSTWSYWTRGRQTLGAGMGTIGEALDQWWVTARNTPALTDLVPGIAERALCAAGAIAARQVTEAELTDADRAGAPDAVAGAWFQFGVTQMDDQQHSLSALLVALDIVDAEAR